MARTSQNAVRTIAARLPRVAAIGAVAITAFAVLSGTASAESCGHYVKRLGPGFVPGKSAAEKIAAEHSQMASLAGEQTAPAASPCGCRGPECRQNRHPASPLSPTGPVRMVRAPELTLIALRDFALELESRTLAFDSLSRPSRGYPQGMIRPPSA